MSNTVKHRRLWKLQEGSKGSLHRLRNQLAEDGCSDSQLILAKNLLQESESCIGSFENAEVAVYWLIQASDQANEEATSLLRYCFRHRKGISDRNYHYVKDCISRCIAEKQFYKAAHDVYYNLTALSGNNVISYKELKNEAARISKGLPVLAFDEINDVKRDYNDNNLTLQEIQEIASIAYKGHSPNVNLEDNDVDYSDHISKSVVLPLKVFTKSFEKLLHFSSVIDQYRLIEWLQNSISCMFLFILFYYVFINVYTFNLIPNFVCYLCMVFMVISTLQMIHHKIGLMNLKLWCSIFTSYNSKIKVTDVESKYHWNSFSPFVLFLISVISTILILPFTSNSWIPYPEFAVISFVLTVCSLTNLIDEFNVITNISIASGFVASLPQVFSSITLPSFFALILNEAHFMRLYIGYGVEITLSIFSMFYFIMVICLFKHSWENPIPSLHSVIIPHLVCLIWWQITLKFFCCTDLIKVLYTLLIWSVFGLSLIILGKFLSVVVLLLFVISYFNRISYLKLFFIVALILFVRFLPNWSKFHKKNKWFIIAQKYRYVFVIIALSSILAPFFSSIKVVPGRYSVDSKAVHSNSIDWDYYYKMCHMPAWQKTTMANVEIDCSPLINKIVSWKGTVTLVRVTNLHNQLKTLLNILPGPFADWICSMYGHYVQNDSNFKNYLSRDQQKCNTQLWNSYEFEIVLRMTDMKNDSPVDIFIDTDDAFTTYIQQLRRGDFIEVKGLLHSDIGGSRPRIQMIECNCIQCSNESLGFMKIKPKSLNLCEKVVAAAHSCFTFFFSPLFEYHPDIPSL